jgi:hypothetical protein
MESTADYGSLFARIALAGVLPHMAKNYKNLPFDLYCPSLLQGKLQPRICKICGMYFPSAKAEKMHSSKVHVEKRNSSNARTSQVQNAVILRRRPGEVLLKRGGNLEWVDEDEVDPACLVNNPPRGQRQAAEVGLPIISSIADWMESPWSLQQ